MPKRSRTTYTLLAVFLLLCALAVVPTAALAQSIQSPPNSDPSTASHGLVERNIVVAPVPGLPFTGRETLVWTHRGPKGSTVKSTYEAKIARNSIGQVYLDSLTPLADPAPDMFFIVDPAAHIQTQCFQAALRCRRDNGPGRISSLRSSRADSSLGEKVIDGITVAGTRQTDLGLSETSDSWYSSDLHATLEIVYDDPDSGTTSAHLAILDRTEPDPALFTPPSTFEMDGVPTGVTSPVPTFSARMESSREANKKKISANLLVLLVVDLSGHPTQVRVAHRVGYGLDEVAVEAVRKYRFKPAMKNGAPVAYFLQIEANFQSFP